MDGREDAKHCHVAGLSHALLFMIMLDSKTMNFILVIQVLIAPLVRWAVLRENVFTDLCEVNGFQ